MYISLKDLQEILKFKWELEIEALLINHIGMQGSPKKGTPQESFL